MGLPLTLMLKPLVILWTRNRLARLAGSAAAEIFLLYDMFLRVTLVPCLPFIFLLGPVTVASMGFSPPTYSPLPSRFMSNSNLVDSPVSLLTVSTTTFLAMPNPASFPMPLRPITCLLPGVVALGLPFLLSYPMFRYFSWHSSKVIPHPSSSTTISDAGPALVGSVISTLVASASQALATSSASEAGRLWYVWNPSWSSTRPWNFSLSVFCTAPPLRGFLITVERGRRVSWLIGNSAPPGGGGSA